MARHSHATVIAVIVIALVSCSDRPKNGSPTAPSLSPTPVFSFVTQSTVGGDGRFGSRVVFPPQNEPVDFLNQLEARYRDAKGRTSTTTYIDRVGHGVWMSEYLRYRISTCSHGDAISRVFTVVDTTVAGRTVIPAECGTPPSGQLPFPPQNEPVDFLARLESKYRDEMRRSPDPQGTFIDPVGHGVWMSDYLRYRVNQCGHGDAVSKVMIEVDSNGTIIPQDCVTIQPPPPPPPPPVTQLSARIDVSGTCTVNQPNNTLSGCTIRAVTTGTVTSYAWSMSVKNFALPNSSTVTEIGCNFPAAGGSYPETFNLRVTGPSGSVTATPVPVTIFKGPNAC